MKNNQISTNFNQISIVFQCISIVFLSLVFLLGLAGVANTQGAPAITEYHSITTKGKSTSTDFNANVNDLIIFEVTANQDIDTWHWFLNGEEQGKYNGVNEGKTTWYLSNNKSDFRIWAKGDDTTYIDTVKVYGENANGNTQTITWTINVAKERGSISGKVTDTSNNPLQGVNVSIRGYSTTTDANGNYTLTNIPKDTYLLVAHKDGYAWGTEKVTVNTNETTTCNLQLAPFNPATITYDGSRIIIENGDATLTTINNTLNNPALLEKLSAKGWLLKVSVIVRGPKGAFYITDHDCEMLKMKGLPTPYISIVIESNGTLLIDNVNITGWDITNNVDITVSDGSPMIRSSYNNTLNIVNTYFKHARVNFLYDVTPDTVDNSTFFESNAIGISSSYSLYKTITHNKFYDCREHNYREISNVPEPPAHYISFYTYTNFSYNYAFGKPEDNIADNIWLGAGSTVIGNEIIYGGWNLANIVRDTFCRNNILHDNGGNHNGFNPGPTPYDRYFINDYTYNIDPYSGYFFQVQPYGDPSEWQYPLRSYIINGMAENCGGGFFFHGGYNSYIYNFTSNNANNAFGLGSGNNYIRNSRFINASEGYPGSYYGLGFSDWEPNTYGYCENGTVIDTTFKNNFNDIEVSLQGTGQYLTVINSYNSGTGNPPSTIFSGTPNKGEVREYVYLDVLVQDQNGVLIPGATITIENLVDSNYPAINLTLPPPPPDLWELPEEPLPLPSVQNLTSITTDSTGHTPLPNYGWSSNPESTVALMFQKRTSSGTTSGYTYKVTAEKDGHSESIIVTPNSSWYRLDPNTYQNTVTLVLDTGAPDTTPPTASNGQPTGTITDNTPTLSVTSNESATCKGSIDIDETYDNMDFTFLGAGTTSHSYNVSSSLADGSHTVYVRCRDTAGNTATTSYSWSFTVQTPVPDTTPPSAVTNLTTSNPTSNSITLTWTAPGDDGNTGTASQYDIRYSSSLITESNWASATQCTGEPSPKVAGSSEIFIVTGLSPNTTYYFALKTADEVPNWSGVSNSPSGKTLVATGTISGTVKDTSNNSIQGATVSDGTRSATTAANGTYTIANVPTGTYTVTASKTGYQSSSQPNVIVNEGATTTVNFVLSPTIKGDLNGDGKVNSLDYALLVAKWFQTTGIEKEDINKDGIVNVRDLGIMMSNWTY